MKNFLKQFLFIFIYLWLLFPIFHYGKNQIVQSDSTYKRNNVGYCGGAFLGSRHHIKKSSANLKIGESFHFEKGLITFIFYDVQEFTVDNLSIRIDIEYDDWDTTIELNSNREPYSYIFENSTNYEVRLKELEYIDDGYLAVLKFKKRKNN